MGGYSEEIMKTLISKNNFFTKPAEDRYKCFNNVDPFPNIPSALLNSADIIKYIMTTGMIEKFNIENMSGATYTCEFSGEYIRWNDKKELIKKTLNENEELELEPDSITFLAVKQYFRIPSYMVLRFNLRVSHVYKGLLLGTGPIVDPGFIGQIFIPLHNLTSNYYLIKKDAGLIEVEFTKMSNNNKWSLKNRNLKKIVDSLKFEDIEYQRSDIKPNRSFEEYVAKALCKEEFHKKEPEKIFINSSLPQKIRDFEKQINYFDEKIRENNEKVQKDTDRMEKTENYVKSFTYIAFLSVVVACFALAWSAYSYLSNSTITKLNEAERKIEVQRQINEDLQKKYNENTNELMKRIDELEKRINK